MVIYIYNYIIYVYTIIPVYRYVLYSIIPPFLAKSSSNPCLGLCKALGFLLPLHLRPYPRSLLVERWFSDMATLTHGTSSIVNLPGWLPLKLEVQKKTTSNSWDTGYLEHLNPVTRLEGGKSRNEARNAGWPCMATPKSDSSRNYGHYQLRSTSLDTHLASSPTVVAGTSIIRYL